MLCNPLYNALFKKVRNKEEISKNLLKGLSFKFQIFCDSKQFIYFSFQPVKRFYWVILFLVVFLEFCSVLGAKHFASTRFLQKVLSKCLIYFKLIAAPVAYYLVVNYLNIILNQKPTENLFATHLHFWGAYNLSYHKSAQ